MNTAIENRLRLRHGKAYQITGEAPFKFESHESSPQGSFIIHTSTGRLDFDNSQDLLHWLDRCNEIGIEKLNTFLPEKKEDPKVELLVGSSVLRDVKDVLMDNIKKVQENKDYIPQAEQINKDANSIIKIAQTEIELHRALNQ